MKDQNNPQFRVFAEAPTFYQSNSVRFFGLTSQGRAGLVRFDYFDTEEEAINHLLACVDKFAETDGTEDEIEEMREDARNGHLTYDAVTAFVQTAEYHSENPEDVTWV